MTKKDLLKVISEAARKKKTDLDLSNKGLRRLPPEIGLLTHMRRLTLEGNRLTTLPPEIGDLRELRSLDVSDNWLSVLPPEIGRLSHLSELFAYDNHLIALPPELTQLSHLKVLELHRNLLTVLPSKIGELGALRDLGLIGNRLRALPSDVGRLVHLQGLHLGNNEITSLPPQVGKLSELNHLCVYNNLLYELPISLRDLTNLRELLLHDNKTLGIPLEVLGPPTSEGPDKARPNPSDILAYYFKSRSGSPLNEAKLILVGRGEAGKTCIVNRLVQDTFAYTNKTEGIQITSWEVPTDAGQVKLNIWDFGGQEIMHATHQFFLTERSLYIVVLNGRGGGEDYDAEYWLKLVSSFGAESPVIMVLNKSAQSSFDLNYRALQTKYPQVRTFVKTDCETRQGVDELHQAIQKTIGALPGVRDRFPRAWFAIKDKLSRMKEELNENYIGYDRFRELCRQLNEPTESEQDRLAFYLHCLGIALNYKDDPRLRDMSVLNPHWVTNGIYRLLNAPALAESGGVLRLQDLARLLLTSDYPPEKHAFLLELMRKFKLCFPYPDDPPDRYLVPELLVKQEPDLGREFDPKACLNFEYHYDILPEGLLPGFIVRTHVLSRGQPRWRSGVVLTWEGCRAIVKADAADRKVVIRVRGDEADARRRLLAVIRADFERIHKSIPKLEVHERVPVPEHPNAVLDYVKLLAFERHGITATNEYIDDQVVSVSVAKMLNGVDVVSARQRAMQMDQTERTLQVFISYSHRDEQFRDELDTHLKLLQRQRVISVWHDRRILAGDDWGGKIDDNLKAANVILLLVSADFIASNYCYEIEMKCAMDREGAGQACVMPVVARACDWHSAPFGRLQPLPKDGRAISLWEDRDSAWNDVAQGIRRVAKELPKRVPKGVAASDGPSSPPMEPLRVQRTIRKKHR